MNRSTTYRRKSAKAFGKMFDNIKSRVAEHCRTQPDSFSRRPDEKLFIEIPDAHTVAIVASHRGEPIQSLRPGPYDLDGEATRINRDSLERYQRSIRQLVDLL